MLGSRRIESAGRKRVRPKTETSVISEASQSRDFHEKDDHAIHHEKGLESFMPKPISVKSPPASTLEERNSVADQSLPKTFDELNEAITQTEPLLRSLKPIKSAWYTYDTEHSHDSVMPDVQHIIGFDKHDGKWRIVYCESDGTEPDPYVCPLTDCKIENRVRAARHIPKLHELIVTSKEEFIAEVDDVISALKSFTQKS
jgi:hypothetical protein